MRLNAQHEDMMQEITNINEEHEDEIQYLIQNKHVPRRGLYDTVLAVVEKNKPEEKVKSDQNPYYMIHCKKIHLPRQKKY